MTTKVGINGFGRIGRLVFRAMADDPAVEVIAVNDLGDKATAAHLLKYDSIHGIRNFDIEVTDDGLVVDGKHVTCFPTAIRRTCPGASWVWMWS